MVVVMTTVLAPDLDKVVSMTTIYNSSDDKAVNLIIFQFNWNSLKMHTASQKPQCIGTH